MDAEEYRKELEEKILKVIEDRLERQEMDLDRAAELAKYILASLYPHMTLKQIYEVAEKFDDHFSELMPIVTSIHKDYDERMRKAVTHHVSELIRQGKLNEATDLIKKGLDRELNVHE